MAVQIKNQVRDGVETIGEHTVMGADLLTGATAAAVETVTHPVRAIRRLERKGAPITHGIRTGAVRQVGETTDALQAYLPEQLLLGGLRLVKERARRKDLFGEIAFRALELINDGLGAATKVVQRMERASTPPSRGAAKAPVKTTVGQTRTAARRTVAKAATTGRTTARRVTSAARRTEGRAVTTSGNAARNAAARTRRARSTAK